MNGLITFGPYSITLNPLLPGWLLIALGGVYAALIVFSLVRRARGISPPLEQFGVPPADMSATSAGRRTISRVSTPFFV